MSFQGAQGERHQGLHQSHRPQRQLRQSPTSASETIRGAGGVRSGPGRLRNVETIGAPQSNRNCCFERLAKTSRRAARKDEEGNVRYGVLPNLKNDQWRRSSNLAFHLCR